MFINTLLTDCNPPKYLSVCVCLCVRAYVRESELLRNCYNLVAAINTVILQLDGRKVRIF